MFFRDGTPLPPVSHVTHELGGSYARIPLGPARPGLEQTLPPGSILAMKNGQYEAMIPLPNGVHTLVAPENRPPYTSKQPREFSLADCPEQEEFMFFTVKRQLTLDFKENSVARSEVIPLFHNHVLWSYVLRMTRCEGDSDGKFELFLDSCGAHLGDWRIPKWQEHPICKWSPPLDVFRIPPLIRMSDADPMVHFVLSTGDHHVCSHRYTEQELRNFAVDNKITLDMGLHVPRAYFSIESIADHMSVLFEHVKTDRSHVDAILRGEKTPGADWQITGGSDGSGDNQTGVYHVHRSFFFKHFKTCMVQLTHSGGRTKLHSFTDEALKMAILVAYDVEVPLPQPGQPIKFLIVKMCCLFGDYFKKDVFAQWELEICGRALLLETRDPLPSSIGELLHLLDVIYEAPPGAMQMAENIAIGVLADMVHLNASASVEQYLMEKVRPVVPAVGCKNAHKILEAVEKFLGAVGSVRKCSVPACWPKKKPVAVKNEEEEEKNEEEEEKNDEEEEKNEEEEVNKETWRDANNGPWLDCTIL